MTFLVCLELCLDPSCSGNGVCQSGQCICGVGWKGEICGQRKYPENTRRWPNGGLMLGQRR